MQIAYLAQCLKIRFATALLAATAAGTAVAESFEPLVARVQMQLKLKDEVIDVIEKGDLLTVTRENEESYSIVTFNGHRGAVSKVNALKLAEAVEVYTDLIKQDPKEGRRYILRAPAWWARGDEKRALADYDMAIQLGYQEPHAYSSRGLFHAALGQYESAIKDYTTAIEKGADDESPFINRAAVYMTLQKYDLAIQDYAAAIGLAPKKSSIYQQSAVAWKLSGELPRAISEFTKAIDLDSKNIPALMGRGFVWFQLEQSARAIADFSKVIELNPRVAEAFNNRAYNHQLLGDYAKALVDYDRTLEIDPNHRLALQNKAWLLSAAEDEAIRNGTKAIALATKACELSQFKDVGDLRALAAAFAEDQQFEKAIGWQEKVVEQVPAAAQLLEKRVLERYRAKRPFRVTDVES